MSGSERTPTGPLSPPSGSNGRKRVPLGPFSPNSKQTEKRRLHCPINSDMQNRGTISENSDPNIQMSGTGSSLTNEPSLLSPSQRKLLGLQATGLFVLPLLL
ncbi:uncharacterized protein LOC135152296 [Daucus carota subsp. sativus]|uniref:uncharacterized protein LOC135152296 n=1 Tax=Daucus carota subsp. sativus TaxID=79200 RepID=UPI00308378E3